MKRIINFIVMLIIMISITSCNDASEGNDIWTIDNLPMVHLKDSTKYLVNPEHIVSPEAEDSINKYLGMLEHRNGIQTVMVIVNKVDRPDDLGTFANDLGNKYGVGSKTTDKGLVVVVAYDQHKWFIAPGKGLESTFPDIRCKHLGEDFIVKHVKGDNPNPNRAMLSLSKALYFESVTEEQYEEPMTGGELAILIFIGILIVAFIIGFFIKNDDGDSYSFLILDEIINSSGGGSFGGGAGGSFGGGSFGGGGAGGSW